MQADINVAKPLMPPLDEFVPCWDAIWNASNASFHHRLEMVLELFPGVKHISLLANGTMVLMTELKALDISVEVITTPFSFVTTSHALWWNTMTPVDG